MNKLSLIAIALATSTTIAVAADDSSLPAKAADDQPVAAGTTANPTATPATGTLSGKEQMDLKKEAPGGTTDMPTKQPDDSSLSTNDGEGAK